MLGHEVFMTLDNSLILSGAQFLHFKVKIYNAIPVRP